MRSLNRWRVGLFTTIALVLSLLVGLHASTAPAETAPSTSPSRELSLLAMGDWGEGTAAQSAIAKALADYADQQKKVNHPISAMLLAGDNFYVPLSGTDDPAWQTLFEKMYDPVRLDFPFYAALGNHDYDQQKFRIEMAYARQHPQSRWKLPSRWYRVDLPAQRPMVTVLMLDSNQPSLNKADWLEQIRWLEGELSKPRVATWVICCAHHPLFSNGVAADNGILQHDWGTLFKKYGVDFYLCGHEHNLQHLEIPGWSPSFVLAGGGGAHPHPMLRDNRGPFSRSLFGFVHFELTPDKATVSYIGANDQPLHIFERTKAGQTKVLMTTPSDPPVDKPLQAILGIYGRLRNPQTQPATKPAGAER